MAHELGELIDGLGDTWSSLGSLCEGLSADDWARPTGCPGWTVQDNVAHVAGLESELMGRASAHQLPDTGLDHIRSDVARWMEITVDERRSWPPEKVLDEFRAVTAERLAQLRAMDDAALDAEAPGPLGMSVPTRRMLPIRVFDCWAHEQDVRRAVRQPGGLEGPAASISFDRMVSGIRAVVPKTLDDVGEAAVGFDVTGLGGRQFTLTLSADEGGKGATELGLPADATTTLRMDLPTFTALCCGRTDPGSVDVEGDNALAARVIAALGFTP